MAALVFGSTSSAESPFTTVPSETAFDCSDVCGIAASSFASDVRGESWTLAEGGVVGESGSGVDEGESGVSFCVIVAGEEGLGDGMEVGEASAADRLARSRSSKFIFCRGFSEETTEGDDALFVMGPPVRCDAKDLRKFESADSANWLDDIGEAGPRDVSRERDRDGIELLWSSGEVSVELRGWAARLSTAWRN